jgi:hypothetical protein
MSEDGASNPGADAGSAVERAKELQARLVTLRLRERTANFENQEAIRRAIREAERELRELGADPDAAEDSENR